MLHDKNKAALIVVLIIAFLSYSVYLYSFLPQSATTSEAALQGKRLWQEYNCGACHQVYGLGGYLGPDLTNIHSIKGLEYTRAFLKVGTEIMPNFNLHDEEIDFLVAYLKDIDITGKADPRTFTIERNGTIGKN